jgi:hypothetical protein
MQSVVAHTHRLGLSWLVSVLLVLAQHGAVLHELGHLNHVSQAAGATLREGGQPADNGICPTCEAFSQVANPAGGAAAHLAAAPPDLAPAPEPSYCIVASSAPTPRSRGPPQA